MTTFRTLFALSAAALATACAGPGSMNNAPMSPGMGQSSPSATMPTMQPHMQAMQQMHDKMMNAKTPAERQALMADHMKAMQGGMGRMKEMQGMHHMRPMQGSSMGDGKAMQEEMAKRHQMMADHQAMMKMMMDMMNQRVPAAQ